MSFSSRNKNSNKYLLFNLASWILIICIIIIIDKESINLYSLKQIFTIILGPAIIILPAIIIHFILYFRDKNKLFICDNDKITFINQDFQLLISEFDIINYRYTQGHWFYADITIYVKNDKKIYISNLNDDFKKVSKQLESWNIKRRSFF